MILFLSVDSPPRIVSTDQGKIELVEKLESSSTSSTSTIPINRSWFYPTIKYAVSLLEDRLAYQRLTVKTRIKSISQSHPISSDLLIQIVKKTIPSSGKKLLDIVG